MKVTFPFIAQAHQTLHSLPIALEMATRNRDVDVHLACMTEKHLDYVRSLASFYPAASVTYELLQMPAFLRRRIETSGPGPLEKIAALFLNRSYFSNFQSIVVPERTSLYLKRMGVRTPRFIWTRHGAGDRAVGFAKDTRLFDFITLSGRKVEERLLRQGAITPGHYHLGTYAKFDIVRRMHRSARPLFADSRPVVLYNPHFSSRLSSWPAFGERILEYFARQDRYNLIFAPHLRLFDRHKGTGEALVRRFFGHPHIIIDPGSSRSVDMTYTMAADLYLGDVSSQVAEFLIRPRPCVFLNAHDAQWENDCNYGFWHLGDVIDDPARLADALEQAFERHESFVPRQKAYFTETFELSDDEPTAPAAADAMVNFLRRSA
ncbi:sensor domain-containing protein [Acetobacter conturbans]|uniref:sensor domain-containing protein n=1 Tax=Acetobacter conturbans TaxID=1737472 RepID=UPI001569208A|nr:sensor domain-containing protein [Acetobacter conturbans]